MLKFLETACLFPNSSKARNYLNIGFIEYDKPKDYKETKTFTIIMHNMNTYLNGQLYLIGGWLGVELLYAWRNNNNNNNNKIIKNIYIHEVIFWVSTLHDVRINSSKWTKMKSLSLDKYNIKDHVSIRV